MHVCMRVCIHTRACVYVCVCRHVNWVLFACQASFTAHIPLFYFCVSVFVFLWRPEVNVWYYLQSLSILLLLLLLLLLPILLLLLLLLQVLPLNLELIRPASPRDYTSESHRAQAFNLGSEKQNPMLTRQAVNWATSSAPGSFRALTAFYPVFLLALLLGCPRLEFLLLSLLWHAESCLQLCVKSHQDHLVAKFLTYYCPVYIELCRHGFNFC